MAAKKIDGVIEAVRYAPDGKVEFVRAYLRRGPTWSDRMLIRREDLIAMLKTGKSMSAGQRIEYMASDF